jgi:ferritin-like metal-binding protein YciE
VKRVEEALGELGVSNPTEICKGMKGLIAEGEEMIQMPGDPVAKDAGLIAAAQRVEHYEIAAYGTARQLADDCGFDGIKDLMDQTLDEESQADKLLTKIATGGMFKAGVNQQATT